jgi:DNA polymerase-3 subunit chi
MNARVHFYHNTPDRLALAGELVGRALERGRKATVRLPDAATLKRFDQLLWTKDALSFLPHVPIDSPLAAETPVVLTAADADAPWPHADMLFNLADDVPPGFEGFRLLVEIVGQTEADKLPARTRWGFYKQRGCDIKAFDAELRVAL